MTLEKYYENNSINEIGIDEVGRGPLFGRVYAAAVILPKDDSFNHSLMKDSKKFTSKKKLVEAANYITSNCISYSVSYVDEIEIDKINIKNATHNAMHQAIKNIHNYKHCLLLVDGSNFKQITYLDDDIINNVSNVCIEKGDNKYSAIAAASILAKFERDKYIEELCEKYPKLDEYYNLSNNKGYGTKQHLEGIKKFGITNLHRKSFGICKNSHLNNIII